MKELRYDLSSIDTRYDTSLIEQCYAALFIPHNMINPTNPQTFHKMACPAPLTIV
jgi:hypothetical protein